MPWVDARFHKESMTTSRPSVVILAGPNGAGYSVHFFFLWLPSADFAVQRVADRVRAGGHDVPEPTVRRRYRTGLRNFFELDEPTASTWRLYDGSGPEPKLIADRLESQPISVYDQVIWHLVRQQGNL